MMMNKAYRMLVTRFKMMNNFGFEGLKQNPMSIAYAVLIPVIFLIIMELIDFRDLSNTYLNPNLFELMKTFNVLLHYLLNYMFLFIVPVYIFISRYNKKCYLKYRNFNISFKEISIANLATFLLFFDGIVAIMLGAVFSKMPSSMSSILLFISMVILAIDIIVVILYLFFQILTNYICGVLHCSHMFFAELIVILVCTLFMYIPARYIPPLSLMDVPIVLVLGIIITLFVALYSIYKKMEIQNDYIKWESKKDTKLIEVKGNVDFFKNYFLMLFINKGVYIEYVLSLVVLYCLLKFFDKMEIIGDGFFPLFIPMFLLSSGIVYSYKQWYDLRLKKALKVTLIIDSIVSMICLLCTCCIASVLIYGEIRLTEILFSFMTFVSLMIMQFYVKLEFTIKTQLIFMMIYGSISYLIYAALGFL